MKPLQKLCICSKMEHCTFCLISLMAISSISQTIAQSLTHGSFPVEKLLAPIPIVTQLQFYMQAVDVGSTETTFRVANSSIANQSPTKFGFLDMFDNLLTESPDPTSTTIGRAQGMFGTSDLNKVAVYNDFNVYFTSGIYNGSTIHIAGRFPVFSGYRELFVGGGTRFFRLATGIATLREIAVNDTTMSAVVEFNVTIVHPITSEKKALCDLSDSCGCGFPGCDYHPIHRKQWMAALNPDKLRLNHIVFPGTHDSATDRIGVPFITRPFAQCQSLSIYGQLSLGARVLDIRVQQDHRVCHGILLSYNIDEVVADLKRFLSETESEIVILEIRTEFGHEDPPEFDKYLVDQLGEYLIHQDDRAFDKTVAELLPGRVICVWKPRKATPPKAGDPLWNSGHLKDNWIDTDLPSTKFESNLKHLGEQPPVSSRKYFYRVENTVTPQADNPVVCVRPVTRRIHRFARLFISQCFAKGLADRLQILSTDFIDEDLVDACAGLTHARIEGKA